ncbi:MAG: bifunctional phosphoribosyl-AMP cyclohydrolase/phosphoribosyl-ATP diphosphatase [Ignavibacteriae bacterium HGW-Ignavibacteriae-3]|nr:MAG: bifunctional phosphoribosyl-AMP cyclohydrolase/phosphoribosyl-ATP diphosphatase [Ignavibacteriae bacterium HGW-Ignavibacteriae-3]
MINKDGLNFKKMDGLMPAIIIDYKSDQILMLGFMNEDAFVKTVQTKLVTFYSRTRNALWTKGETSGNFLKLVDIKKDCDSDSLLISVIPHGPVCHDGTYSCFGDSKTEIKFLNELSGLIKQRKINLPEKSYTTKLFQEGADRIIQKVGEEAVETVIAAKNRDKPGIINETADLIFHLLVMLAEQEIELEEIVKKLIERHQIKSE